MRSLTSWVLVLACSAAAHADVVTVNFDGSPWPTTNTAMPACQTVLSAAGLPIDIGIAGFQSYAPTSSTANYAGLGARCIRTSSPITAATKITIGNCAGNPIKTPSGISFKAMAAGTVADTATPQWMIELRAIPNSGSPQVVAQWGNQHKEPFPKAYVWVRLAFDLSSLPAGDYTLELAVIPIGPSLPTLAIDEIEVCFDGDPPPMLVAPTQLESELGTWPPIVPMTKAYAAERQWRIHEFDRHALNEWVNFHPSAGPPIPATPTDFNNWFTDRARRVIDEIIACQPAVSEAFIFKLYSSAYVVKTSTGCFAVDLTDGPNSFNDRFASNIAMHVPREILEKICEVIDFLMVTHFHHDHALFPVIDVMMQKGKPVYGPNAIDLTDGFSLLERYNDASPGGALTAALQAMIDLPAQTGYSDVLGAPIPSLPNWNLRVFKGRQAMPASCCPPSPVIPPALGTALPVEYPVNHSFHVTTADGLRFMIVGDHRDFYPPATTCSPPTCNSQDSILWTTSGSPATNGWWPRLLAQGIGVDVKLGAGPLLATWLPTFFAHFSPVVRIDGHEWELIHDNPQRVATFFNSELPATDQSIPMVFGEKLHYRAFPVAPHFGAPTSGVPTIEFTTVVPLHSYIVHWRVAGQTVFNTTISPTPLAAWPATYSLALTGATSNVTYEFYVETKTLAPTSGAAPKDGPRYGSAIAPFTATAP